MVGPLESWALNHNFAVDGVIAGGDIGLDEFLILSWTPKFEPIYLC